MVDRTALQQLRDQRFFGSWTGFVSPERTAASEASIRHLIDDLLALAPNPTEEAIRRAVNDCVRRFNALDDGWICTIEREDIFEQVGRVANAYGFKCEEVWLGEREW